MTLTSPAELREALPGGPADGPRCRLEDDRSCLVGYSPGYRHPPRDDPAPPISRGRRLSPCPARYSRRLCTSTRTPTLGYPKPQAHHLWHSLRPTLTPLAQ